MTTCFGAELFIRFIVRVFCERLSICVYCYSFLFSFEGEMWDLIILISHHCLSNYLIVAIFGDTVALWRSLLLFFPDCFYVYPKRQLFKE